MGGHRIGRGRSATPAGSAVGTGANGLGLGIPGSGAQFGSRKGAGVQPVCPHAAGSVPGFRHFLGEPGSDEKTLFDGQPPQASRPTEDRFRRAMQALSDRLLADPGFTTPLAPGLHPHDNPGFPAGYTYLLQFVAHDLVQSAVPLSEAGDGGVSQGNLRRQPLVLETLYGDGPVQGSRAYRFERLGRPRRYLRIGPALLDDGSTPARDIPRQRLFEAPPAAPGPIEINRPTEVLIADARNDDNATLSQLVVAFSLLHNAVVDRLDGLGLGTEYAATDDEMRLDQYHAAREVVTLVYRRILRRDAMGRLLHPAVLAAYDRDKPTFLDPLSCRPEAPPVFEFAYAAFRTGHSLVRDEYGFSDAAARTGQSVSLAAILSQSSEAGGVRIPPNAHWLATWSRFFEVDPRRRPDLARRIGPTSTGPLFDASLFPATDGTGAVGLDYRDLISAGLARLWRLEPLVARLSALAPDWVSGHRMLADKAYRSGLVGAFLADSLRPVPAAIASALADDPPLPFFLRFEAGMAGAAEGGGDHGRHLGILGSLIVAETIFGGLAATIPPSETAGGPLATSIRAALVARLGARAAGCLPELTGTGANEIDSVPKLLQALPRLVKGGIPGPSFL
ncbi:peroxidase family protein [Prosthecomicrobium sp. N25]|uniref:peroxidase family protein n=1 Tax=Prosthecomicrobium sp. N25 TaxID=3129254 RepID=UPI0030785C74